MSDIANIFLFNDFKKVRVGIERPSNWIAVPTTDPSILDNIISMNDIVYKFRYPYGWDIPQDTAFTEGNIEYTFQTQGLKLYGYFQDYWKIKVKSNLIMISNLPFAMANITFNGGDIEKNGISVGNSATVVNGDTIRISVSNYIPNINQPNIFDIDISGIIVRWIVELSDPHFMGFDSEVSRPGSSDNQEVTYRAQTNVINSIKSLIVNVVEKNESISYDIEQIKEIVTATIRENISEILTHTIAEFGIEETDDIFTLNEILKENIYDTETLIQELIAPSEIITTPELDSVSDNETLGLSDIDAVSETEVSTESEVDSESEIEFAATTDIDSET